MITILDGNKEPKAIIEDYSNDAIYEQINGAYDLTFVTTMDPEKSPYIAVGHFAEVDGQLFNITNHRRTRSSDGRVAIKVYCEHVSYDLNDTDFENGFVHAGQIPDLLDMALDGTNFSAGIIEPSGVISVDLNEEGVTARAVLLEIARLAGGELRYDGYTVDLLDRRGSEHSVMFSLGKNLRGIIKDVNSERTAYEIDVLELRELPEYAGFEEFELGDTVYIIDDEMGIDEQQRIIEYTYSPRRRVNSKVVISARIDAIQNQLYRLQKNSVAKDKYMYGTRIGPDVGFESVRYDKKARSVINADTFALQKGDGNGSWTNAVWFDTNDDEYKFSGTLEAASFVGGSIQIGSSFSVDNTGHMTAVGGEFSGDITASVITGGQIVGTTITGALIQTQGAGNYPRIELNSSGSYLSAQANSSQFIDIRAFSSGTPAVYFDSGSALTLLVQTTTTFGITTPDSISISGLNIGLSAANHVNIQNWSKLRNSSTNQTLQQALDAAGGTTGYTGTATVTDGTTVYDMIFENGVLKSLSI